MTARFAGASNVPFLLIQLPQILLNYQNLAAGDKAALFAVPWLVRSLNFSHFFSFLYVIDLQKRHLVFQKGEILIDLNWFLILVGPQDCFFVNGRYKYWQIRMLFNCVRKLM